MAKFESTNPLLNVDRIRNSSRRVSSSSTNTGVMTLHGTAQKSVILLVLCAVTALLSYNIFLDKILTQSASIASLALVLPVAGIIAFIAYLIGVSKPGIAFICAPVYAITEGLFLGLFSVGFELKFPGVVISALLGTISIFIVMFTGFSSGLFKVTQKFRTIVIASVIGFFVLYLLNLVVALFTGSGFDFMAINSSTPWLSIGISALAVIVGACLLLLDFDNIAQLHSRVSKDMEWVCGMGLLATLVWIYIELVKLFAKLAVMNED